MRIAGTYRRNFLGPATKSGTLLRFYAVLLTLALIALGGCSKEADEAAPPAKEPAASQASPAKGDLARYLTLQKLSKQDQPRESRSQAAVAAKLKLMQNYPEFVKSMEGFDAVVQFRNEFREKAYSDQVKASIEAARKEGRPVSRAQLQRIWATALGQLPDPIPDREDLKKFKNMREPWYEKLQEIIDKELQRLPSPAPERARPPFEQCEPDIDSVSPEGLSPGTLVLLLGTCFGAAPGGVRVKVDADHVVDLVVQSWSPTRVEAYLHPDLTGYRPFPDSRIWLVTAGPPLVRFSNWQPVDVYVMYSAYFGTWTKDVDGGFSGASETHTFLKGKTLGDPDFCIEWVERHHSGSGWSELRSPRAGGQNMAQRWHVGVDAGKHAHMHLLYRMRGPKGVPEPDSQKLDGWFLLGDADYTSPNPACR